MWSWVTAPSWCAGWLPGRWRREEGFLDILVAPSPKITLLREGDAGTGVWASCPKSPQIFLPCVWGGELQSKLMICSFVIREKESDIPLTSGDESPWGRMNQPYKRSVCIPKWNSHCFNQWCSICICGRQEAAGKFCSRMRFPKLQESLGNS